MRLIDADKVREKMKNTFDMQELYLPTHFMELVIDEVPTVDPVKHGRWRPHFTEPYENEGEVYWWVCSECEEAENRKSDYCPNCGAKMDEEDK